MCYAILEVRYKAEVETVKIADAETLASKLTSLQKNDFVEHITVFKPERVLRRQTTWTEE